MSLSCCAWKKSRVRTRAESSAPLSCARGWLTFRERDHPRCDGLRCEQVVGDSCDLFRDTPRFFELRELTFHSATLCVLVRRHLECEPHGIGEVHQHAAILCRVFSCDMADVT